MSGRNVIQIEDVWKQYRLGIVSHATLQQDLQSWWARLRGKVDPNSCLNGGRAAPFRFGERFWALQGVSFDVQEGEVIGIIGRNGAGKSTLLKILSRVTAPTRGQIKVRGRIASLLEVGTGFHPELTGRENIFLNGAILGMSKNDIRDKLGEIIAFSEIEQFVDTPVKRYSSGMYVRLAFAVAAHLQSETLVVDEVLAVGDTQFQKKCLGKMENVGRDGRTVFFVSHNMAAVQRLCTRVVWIDGGRIRQVGTPAETIHAYLSSSCADSSGVDVDLRDWPERYGNGEARITSARLLNATGEVTSVFYRNAPLKIEFVVEMKRLHKPNFSAVIFSESGIKLLHLCHHDGNDFHSEEFLGKQVVSLSIPNLPLNAGNFKVTLGVHSQQMMAYDVVSEVLHFSVEDAVESPRPYRSIVDNGYCWTPNSWTVTQRND